MNKTVAVRQFGAPAQIEAKLGEAMYPGTLVQFDDVGIADQIPVVYACRANDYLYLSGLVPSTGSGFTIAPGQFLAVMEDELQGDDINDALAVNTPVQVRRFLVGDVINCIVEEGESFGVGTRMFLSATNGLVTSNADPSQVGVLLGRSVTSVSSNTGDPVSARRVKVLISFVD